MLDNNFDKLSWGQKKQAEKHALYELIDATLNRIKSDSYELQNFLMVQSRMDQYSVPNTLLLFAQKPYARQVKSFDDWKKEGVFIRSTEKAFSLLEPSATYRKSDGSTGTSYQVKKVFDISQTNAKEQIKSTHVSDSRTLLKALVHHAPVGIEVTDEMNPPDANTFFDDTCQTIFIRRGLTDPELFSSLFYGLATVALSSSSSKSILPLELKAKCISYMLCKRYGVKEVSFDFSDVTKQLQDMELSSVRNLLEDIKKGFHLITERMSKNLNKSELERS